MRTNPKCTGSDKEEGRTIYTPRSNQGLETNKQMKVIKITIYQPIYQSKKGHNLKHLFLNMETRILPSNTKTR